MSGINFRIDVTRDTVGPALARMVRAGEDLGEPMDEIGAMIVASTLDRFERGVDPTGTPWIPSQRALAEGGQTLVKSGRLRDSITHVAGRDFVDVGTNVIYAATHHFGRGAIPERPILGVSREDEDEIAAILRDHFGRLA